MFLGVLAVKELKVYNRRQAKTEDTKPSTSSTYPVQGFFGNTSTSHADSKPRIHPLRVSKQRTHGALLYVVVCLCYAFLCLIIRGMGGVMGMGDDRVTSGFIIMSVLDEHYKGT